MKHGIFITGTGTDIGKTWFSGLLVKYLREKGINAGYYKAALSGAEECNGKLIPGDAKFVCETAALPIEPEQLVSCIYRTAVSPALAAELEGNQPQLEVIEQDYHNLFRNFDFLVVEGSGGIVCPIRRDDSPIMLTDIIQRLDLDLLLVADAGLGTINSTILTLEYAQRRNLTVRGIVLNRFDSRNFLHQDNRQSLEMMTGLPVAASIKEGELSLTDFDLHLLQR